MFATVNHFYPSLIFPSKAGAYQSGGLTEPLALPTNIWPGLKWPTVTNVLAYYGAEPIPSVESFIAQASERSGSLKKCFPLSLERRRKFGILMKHWSLLPEDVLVFSNLCSYSQNFVRMFFSYFFRKLGLKHSSILNKHFHEYILTKI